MTAIQLTNQDGENITLGNQAPYFLETIDGAGEVGVEIESQKAYRQDGSTYIDNTLNRRAISIEGMIITRSDPEAVLAARRRMQRVLNPKLGEVIVTYRQQDQVKEIVGLAESTPVFPSGPGSKGRYYQKFLVHLVCHQPFWRDIYTESKEIITWIGGMTFPWVLPSRFAMKGPPIINIVNRGDVQTPVRIEFKGPATNPKITNQTTGKYIQVRRELGFGDLLIITTHFGGKRVEINGENAFHWIDIDSTFWKLTPGDNVVVYESDEPTEPAAVTISYRNRYVGV